MTTAPLSQAPVAELADYRELTDVALRVKFEPERGLYIAEGAKVIERAVAAGHRPRSFLVSDRKLDTIADAMAAFPGAVAYVGTEAELEAVAGFHVHRGALAAMNRPELPAIANVLAGARRVAVIEDVMSHTNVGAIFRSAAAVGVDAVLISPRCADPLYRRSVRVSMGTVFQVPWTRLEPWPGGLDLLREAGFTVAALALTDDAVSLADIEASPPERLAWLLGTEGEGLTHGAIASADVVVKIPMAGGVDSLNVAAASAVAFWASRPRP